MMPLRRKACTTPFLRLAITPLSFPSLGAAPSPLWWVIHFCRRLVLRRIRKTTWCVKLASTCLSVSALHRRCGCHAYGVRIFVGRDLAWQATARRDRAWICQICVFMRRRSLAVSLAQAHCHLLCVKRCVGAPCSRNRLNDDVLHGVDRGRADAKRTQLPFLGRSGPSLGQGHSEVVTGGMTGGEPFLATARWEGGRSRVSCDRGVMMPATVTRCDLRGRAGEAKTVTCVPRRACAAIIAR